MKIWYFQWRHVSHWFTASEHGQKYKWLTKTHTFSALLLAICLGKWHAIMVTTQFNLYLSKYSYTSVQLTTSTASGQAAPWRMRGRPNSHPRLSNVNSITVIHCHHGNRDNTTTITTPPPSHHPQWVTAFRWISWWHWPPEKRKQGGSVGWQFGFYGFDTSTPLGWNKKCRTLATLASKQVDKANPKQNLGSVILNHNY